MIQKNALIALLNRLHDANLTVTFWDGSTQKFITNKSRPAVHVTITDRDVVKQMLRNISLALGEGYMDERVLIDGPIEEFVAIGWRNKSATQIIAHADKYRRFHKNIKRNQKEQIAHHYDLGNDFYKLWLDPTLTYTCAYFRGRRDSLEVAQANKRNHVLKKLQLKKGMTLLDIGCGWGALLIDAAKKYGVRGLGVTLSEEQYKLAQTKIKKLGLSRLVSVKLMNYQDVPSLKKQFDRVVSVGFFEAVGQGNLHTYFDIVDKVLKPGGITVLHTITNESVTTPDPWIDKYIFPGGYIPAIPEVTSLFPDYNFYMKDYESLGQHYAMTLREWRKGVAKHKKEIIESFDDTFYRMWWFWLGACIAGFETGQIGLSQWILTKGYTGDNWPLTREYLYK